MDADLDDFIGKIKTLPSPPGVLVNLVGMFQKPDRDVDEVATLILKDPSLTAGVLRHANSASPLITDPLSALHHDPAPAGSLAAFRIGLTHCRVPWLYMVVVGPRLDCRPGGGRLINRLGVSHLLS